MQLKHSKWDERMLLNFVKEKIRKEDVCMLKVHSFLQRMKKHIQKVCPSMRKHKVRMATIAYAMAMVLLIISPDYINGGSPMYIGSKAAAQTFDLLTENVSSEEVIDHTEDVEEETDHEAIRTNLNTQTSQFERKEQVIEVSTQLLTVKLMRQTLSETDTLNAEDLANSISSGAAVRKDNQNLDEEAIRAQEGVQKTEENQEESNVQEEVKTEAAVTEEVMTETASTTKLNLSKKDIEVLQRIVEAEATGEDVKGKILVANVILNRVNSSSFPDTVEKVVFQSSGGTYQFSPIKDKRYWSVTISEDTKTAVNRVIAGEDYSQGALYFSARAKADKNSMKWFDENLIYLFRYGNHEFYKE